MMQTIITILIIAIAAALVGAGLYFYLRDKSLEEIREDVYQLFLQAEHKYVETGAGKQKMAWVISKARGLLPTWAQTIVSEELLYKVFEKWFRAVKDLLDDGKVNGSQKNEE